MLGTYLYIKSINQKRFRGRISTRSFFVFLIPGGIGIWKCWFLRRGENRSTRRKTSRSHKKGPTTNSTHLWRPRQHWDPRLIGGRRVLHHCTILVHSWPLTSAKMLFTRPKSLIWSFFSLKLRYPALYSIYSSGAGFIAACNHNYTLFLFNCQLRISWCHSPYATAELLDEIKVSAPLFHWALIFQ